MTPPVGIHQIILASETAGESESHVRRDVLSVVAAELVSRKPSLAYNQAHQAESGVAAYGARDGH